MFAQVQGQFKVSFCTIHEVSLLTEFFVVIDQVRGVDLHVAHFRPHGHLVNLKVLLLLQGDEVAFDLDGGGHVGCGQNEISRVEENTSVLILTDTRALLVMLMFKSVLLLFL